MKINIRIDDSSYHDHFYFFGRGALENMVLLLVEKFYGNDTMIKIQSILKVSELKTELKNYQFKVR
jgi:hypothetical protein